MKKDEKYYIYGQLKNKDRDEIVGLFYTKDDSTKTHDARTFIRNLPKKKRDKYDKFIVSTLEINYEHEKQQEVAKTETWREKS